MCLLVVLSGVVAGVPLVLAGNRDERLTRPAEPMAELRDEPRTWGGRDLAAGGTWLAVNEHGVVAGLTNQPMPDGPDPAKRTRGELPLFLTRFADAGEAAAAFVDAHDPADYNPAWLLVADRGSAHTIELAGDRATTRPLGPGVHLLENKPFGAPSGKLDRVRALLGDLDGLDLDAATARLAAVLGDHQRAPIGDDVPEDRRDLAAAVGAICVHTEIDGTPYGTRWSGIVAVPEAGTPAIRVADGPPCTTPYAERA